MSAIFRGVADQMKKRMEEENSQIERLMKCTMFIIVYSCKQNDYTSEQTLDKIEAEIARVDMSDDEAFVAITKRNFFSAWNLDDAALEKEAIEAAQSLIV